MSNEYEVESRFNKNYSIISRKMVRMLSENSRISISEMAKQLGVSRYTISEKLKRLEKELGLRYTLELNEAALGLSSPHLIAVKFRKNPNYDKIKSILLASCIPQVAFSASGDYDLVVYANALSGSEYAKWDKAMKILLSEFHAIWQPSEIIHKQLCFFPLRSEMISRTQVDPSTKQLLMLLNDNARMSFQQISKKLNMHFNTVKYNYDKLLKQGVIRRSTITLDMIKGISFVAWFSNYSPAEGYEESSAKARIPLFIDDEHPLINRYMLTASLIGSHDLFSIDVFDNKATAMKYDIKYHKSLFVKHGIKMAIGEITSLLIGRLPIRSIDPKKEYKVVQWTTKFDSP